MDCPVKPGNDTAEIRLSWYEFNYVSMLEEYDYLFPPEAVAQQPVQPRDSARLLVYKKATDEVIFTTFSELPVFLPPHSVLVVNNSKVIPARLQTKRANGGQVEIFYLCHDEKSITAMANRKLVEGEVLRLNQEISFTVAAKNGKYVELTPSFSIKNIFAVLDTYGTTPIPPYIKQSPLSEEKLKKEYQTVFAAVPGSVAAPTASLHFTPKLLQDIQQAGHDIAYVTLHVNLGTFAPLTTDQLTSGRLHEEWYAIDEKTAVLLNQAKKSGRPIIAVGTTAVRTLESASNSVGKLTKLSGSTDLFITPGYQFKFVDHLMTNFHVPKSSLLMLVAACIGREKLLELYAKAIAAKFRLFSFGDGMLIV